MVQSSVGVIELAEPGDLYGMGEGVLGGKGGESRPSLFEEREFQAALEGEPWHSQEQQKYLHLWLDRFLWFCADNKKNPAAPEVLVAYRDRLRLSGVPVFMLKQLDTAVRIYLEIRNRKGPGQSSEEIELGDPAEGWGAVLAQLGNEIRLRHYSAKTLKTYSHWVKTFYKFHSDRHPRLLTSQDAKDFLSELALEEHVAAGTQNQAFNALLFLFEHVLKKEFSDLANTPRAKLSMTIPTVLTRQEVARVLSRLEPPYDLVGGLLYGCGLRLGEVLCLRVQDVDFGNERLLVFRGKGGKCRRIPLPMKLLPALRNHLEGVRAKYLEDVGAGFAGVLLPHQLDRKNPKAAREWPWQWFFPGKELTFVRESGGMFRSHMHESQVQKALKKAVTEAGLSKPASAHTLRHSYATHLLQMGYDIKTLQELLGHSDVKTTMIYIHTARDSGRNLISPLDA